MTDAEVLARLKRIVRVIQEGRYSVLFATERPSGRKLVLLCENTALGGQLSQVTALAQLDPLPSRGLLVPSQGCEQVTRSAQN